MNDYYVYGYSDPTSSDPFFYIGKGKGRRAYKHLEINLRNGKTYFYNKLNKLLGNGIDPIIIFFQTGLNEHEAINLEINLVTKYGRCDIGTGYLCNHTIGGDGGPDASIGHDASFDTRIRQSRSQINRPKEITEKQRESKIKSQGRAVNAISCLTGEIVMSFECVNSVKRKGIDPSSVCRVLSGRQKSSGGYFWQYV